MDPPAARHVALIGMMGAGKSTAGRLLASRWGLRCVDVDVTIEEETGRTLRELWREGGVEAYRPLERRTVERALASLDPVVLAAPGGAVIDDAMSAALRVEGVTVVYLRAEVDTLVRHVGDGGRHRRPLLGDDPRQQLVQLLDERAGLYEALADHVVDVDRLTPAGVASAVLTVIGPGPGT